MFGQAEIRRRHQAMHRPLSLPVRLFPRSF
ncbi:hypothetical protein GGE56_007736, partial [Rhizobium leguminosarum]|nr:hypothetical protein [Rhizobium leguminosarum]